MNNNFNLNNNIMAIDFLEFGTVIFNIPKYMLNYNPDTQLYEKVLTLNEDGTLNLIDGIPSIKFNISKKKVSDDDDNLINPSIFDTGNLINYNDYLKQIETKKQKKETKEQKKKDKEIKKALDETQRLKKESEDKDKDRQKELKIYKSAKVEIDPDEITGFTDLDILIERVFKDYLIENDETYAFLKYIHEFISLNKRMFHIPLNKLPKKQQTYFIVKYPELYDHFSIISAKPEKIIPQLERTKDKIISSKSELNKLLYAYKIYFPVVKAMNENNETKRVIKNNSDFKYIKNLIKELQKKGVNNITLKKDPKLKEKKVKEKKIKEEIKEQPKLEVDINKELKDDFNNNNTNEYYTFDGNKNYITSDKFRNNVLDDTDDAGWTKYYLLEKENEYGSYRFFTRTRADASLKPLNFAYINSYDELKDELNKLNDFKFIKKEED
jgi:hypothetical protein